MTPTLFFWIGVALFVIGLIAEFIVKPASGCEPDNGCVASFDISKEEIPCCFLMSIAAIIIVISGIWGGVTALIN